MKTYRNVILLLLGSLALASAADESKQETVITSDRFEMVGGETENYFYFYGNVEVTGTNLHATCNEMEVVASRQAKSAEAVGDVGAIQSIVMKGQVYLEQSGREAFAGRAEIFPREGKVVLMEDPRVEDSEGTVTGYRMTLFKDRRTALVEGPPDGQGGTSRPKITLPGFQDLGYQDEPESPNQGESSTEAEPPQKSPVNSRFLEN